MSRRDVEAMARLAIVVGDIAIYHILQDSKVILHVLVSFCQCFDYVLYVRVFLLLSPEDVSGQREAVNLLLDGGDVTCSWLNAG